MTLKLDNIVYEKLKFLAPNTYAIENFIKEVASNKIQKRSSVLDAGAGTKPYKNYFEHHSYESVDVSGDHDYICDLERCSRFIKKKYDIIICTEVLEHVKRPWLVVSELRKLLKPGGKIYITVPFSWGIHDPPHHYFHFTRFGLKTILEEAGFKKIQIYEKGGYFWHLSKACRDIGDVFNQHMKGKKKIIVVPLYVIVMPIMTVIIPAICFPLDRLDKRRHITIGYLAEATK